MHCLDHESYKSILICVIRVSPVLLKADPHSNMWNVIQTVSRNCCLGCLSGGGEAPDNKQLYIEPRASKISIPTPTQLPVLPDIDGLYLSSVVRQAHTGHPPPSSPTTTTFTLTQIPTLTATDLHAAAMPLHARLLSIPPQPQPACPLFALLPPEVRSEILSLALADYPDPSPTASYSPQSCYTRPAYFAPRKTDWALLASCRAVYAEAWHLPFVLREQTHWLSSQDRAPPEYTTGQTHGGGRAASEVLARRLAAIGDKLGGAGFEIAGVRVFAQMYKLEDGSLATLLGTPGLRPRAVALTVRHTDWWYWERDRVLRVEGQKWLEGVCGVLPGSVRSVCVELESLERKRAQVDEIVKQMRERWFFKRKDGMGLFADVSGGGDEVTRWSGNSTWGGRRWARDEADNGRLDYYVVAVWFRPERVVQRRGGVVSDGARRDCEGGVFEPGRLKLTVPEEMGSATVARPKVRVNPMVLGAPPLGMVEGLSQGDYINGTSGHNLDNMFSFSGPIYYSGS